MGYPNENYVPVALRIPPRPFWLLSPDFHSRRDIKGEALAPRLPTYLRTISRMTDSFSCNEYGVYT